MPITKGYQQLVAEAMARAERLCRVDDASTQVKGGR